MTERVTCCRFHGGASRRDILFRCLLCDGEAILCRRWRRNWRATRAFRWRRSWTRIRLVRKVGNACMPRSPTDEGLTTFRTAAPGRKRQRAAPRRIRVAGGCSFQIDACAWSARCGEGRAGHALSLRPFDGEFILRRQWRATLAHATTAKRIVETYVPMQGADKESALGQLEKRVKDPSRCGAATRLRSDLNAVAGIFQIANAACCHCRIID